MSSQSTFIARAILVLLALSSFAAEPPRMVVDLPGVYAGSSITTNVTAPPFWTTVGGTTWFVASRTDGIPQVWRTDGTPEGTVQATEIYAAGGGHAEGPFLGVVNRQLIYAGNDLGRKLFALSMDGGKPVVLAGIVKAKFVHTIFVGPVLDGYLYFASFFNYEMGFELWRTDGTRAGTQCLDLSPGKGDSVTGSYLVRFDDSVWFSADLPAGKGLYRTDGTTAGTRFVRPGLPLGVAGNRLIFSEKNPSGTWALRATDGTSDELLYDGYVSGTFQPQTVGSRLYYLGNEGIHGRELWTTDGTAEGTARLTDVIPEPDRWPEFLTRAESNLFYMARTPNRPCESTLFAVKDGEMTPGVCLDDLGTAYSGGFALGDRYCFGVSEDRTFDQSLWCSDGGSLTARMAPSGARWGTTAFTAGVALSSGSVLFGGVNELGREPWLTDGTPAGTRMLANIAGENYVKGSNPRFLSAALNRVFFTASVNDRPTIGVSDGSASGTSTVSFNDAIGQGVGSGERYFFALGNNRGHLSNYVDYKLGVSDGTAAGTSLLKTIVPASRFAPVSNGLVFSDKTEPAGYYFTDGTAAGTRRLSDGSGDVVTSAGFAWFRGMGGLMRSDGTPEGTRTLESESFSSPISALTVDGITFMLDNELILARTSVTAPQLTRIKNMYTGWGRAGSLVASAHHIYVVLPDGLWRTDGTETGTVRLSPEIREVDDCTASTTVVGDTLFWLVNTLGATTLWRSEGTVESTFPIATMPFVGGYSRSGPCPSIASAGGLAYFAGESQFEGSELWVSDGTQAGTRLLEDIWPGIHNSSPADFTAAGNQVFFSAATPTAERELWVIDARTGKRRRGVRH